MKVTGATLSHLPGRFRVARMLGTGYSLRCVLFHDVCEKESSFTKGLGVTITPHDFEAALVFLTKHYTLVRLEDVLENSTGRRLPHRPLLVTFDDAYASVFQTAAPLCAKLGVPAVFFVNATCLNNRQLMLDNLVCYVANVKGLDTINDAIRSIGITGAEEVKSLADVFMQFLPAISLSERQVFRDALVRAIGINECDLAGNAKLYLTSQQLRHLAAHDFEIGNHTFTHVNCRCLRGDDFAEEIDRNKSELEEATGTKVRSFSVPYGSSADLPPGLVAHLQKTGHQAGFLVESLANTEDSNKFHLNRVSVKARRESALFSEIEVFPRLRAIRNLLTSGSDLNPRTVSQPVQ